MPRAILRFACLLLLVGGFAASGAAWDSRGHYRVAEAAALAQPEEVPAFFRWGAPGIGHSAIDPDVFKERETPELRHQEFPEHFLDYELVADFETPPLRYDFIQAMVERGIDPSRAGFVLHAITEGTERLALAFAEHRCWPENPYVRAKAIVFAGHLAHYAGDMVQPLHTSIHYNGRARPDGSSPGTGIHAKVDGLFERSGFEPSGQVPVFEFLPELWTGVGREFAGSHALVDRVYVLEPALDRLYAEGTWDPELTPFAVDRYDRAVNFIGSLFLTAWRQSAEISPSRWLSRVGPGGAVEACTLESQS